MILENAIRRFLKCQSENCTFFQSAAYIDLRLSVCAFVLHGGKQPSPLVLSIPPFVLSLQDDGCTITLKPPLANMSKSTSLGVDPSFISALSQRALD